MHEFCKFRGWMGDSSHIDWITSPGAKIQSLHKMWQMDYGQESRVQDVLVLAGLNNVLRGESIGTIMEHINKAKLSIKKMDQLSRLPCFCIRAK